MENNELQNIWKKMEEGVPSRSKTELRLLLQSKTRETLNKFIITTMFSIFVSVGFAVFLIYTGVKRVEDLMYVANNGILLILTGVAIYSGFKTWFRLRLKPYHLPLKDWLKSRINMLSVWITGPLSKLYIYMLPFLYIMTILSIHVYYEYKPFTSVLRNNESLIGLSVALPIGLFTAYFAAARIRRFQVKNLEFLKDLLCRLEKD